MERNKFCNFWRRHVETQCRRRRRPSTCFKTLCVRTAQYINILFAACVIQYKVRQSKRAKEGERLNDCVKPRREWQRGKTLN